MKQLVKNLANTFGYEIRGNWDPNLPFIHPIRLDGHQIGFWITNSHAKSWWCRPELKMNAELRMLKKLCNPGDVVFDVGAHHGMLSIAFSLWSGPGGKVHSFEANPENTLTLQANISNNGIKNCTGYFTAIGESTGTIRITGESADPGGRGGRETPMISLDEFYESNQLDRVDLIKIDVEGFEYQVLKGAKRLLAHTPKLAIEMHQDDLPRFGGSAHGIFDLLDIDRYHASMMVRSDSWDDVIELEGADDLPSHGVVNVFLEPKS